MVRADSFLHWMIKESCTIVMRAEGVFPVRQPADGAWQWKSRAGMSAALSERFTEFGRSKGVQADEGKPSSVNRVTWYSRFTRGGKKQVGVRSQSLKDAA